VGNSKRPRRGPWRGRARDASADALFERALQGESSDQGDSSETQRRFDARSDRKTLQLCRQVQRALSLSLGGECADELLGDLYVASVEPLGGPGQLGVRVILSTDSGASAGEVMSRLTAQTPRLRAAVAREISRKRVPNLSFIVLPSGGTEGGNHAD
jgi:hypothetical protein